MLLFFTIKKIRRANNEKILQKSLVKLKKELLTNYYIYCSNKKLI